MRSPWGLALRAGLFALSAGFLSCGSDRSTRPELTPLESIEDFRVAAVSDTSALLVWSAPGGPNQQPAVEYDIRYSFYSLEIVSWNSASRVPGVQAPASPGVAETLQVGGLLFGRVYSFGIKALDGSGTWSEKSNLVWVNTQDNLLPAAIQDLRVQKLDQRSITLTWTAPGDDSLLGTVDGYFIRYSTSPIDEDSWSRLPDYPFGGEPGPSGTRETVMIEELLSDHEYYFVIQARDDAYNRSPFSNQVIAQTARDQVPPAAVTTLLVEPTAPGSVRLSWVAPGDDGESGVVAGYDVRYSTRALTEASWATAAQLHEPVAITASGEATRASIHDLARDTIYYFGVRAVDEAGNRAALSNVVEARTEQGGSVWFVAEDGSGDAPSIQAAIDIAPVGSTILVGPGVYYEQIRFNGKNLHLESRMGPEHTILDGSRNESGPLVHFGQDNSGESEIRGFTIRGSREDGIQIFKGSPGVIHNHIVDNAAGIVVLGGRARIVGNLLRGNRDSERWGGALIVRAADYRDLSSWADILVEGNTIESNHARFGGAAFFGTASVAFRDNLVRQNTSAYDGGAIFTFMAMGHIVIEHNTFIGNVANDHGGAMAAWNTYEDQGGAARMDIRYNVFFDNMARSEGATNVPINGAGGALHLIGNYGTVINNTIVGNHARARCGEGGIGFDYNDSSRPQDWIVEKNIIAFNNDGGFGCTGKGEIERFTIRNNLLFGNVHDLGCGIAACDTIRVSTSVFADPRFCDPENGDFRLARNSPAILHPAGPMGAFPVAGCPHPADPPLWGRYQARY